MEKVICLGDSLTKGMVGFTYINYLNNNYEYINKGLNGDTTICALERLQSCLNEFKDVNTYIISIGINDVLVPFLSTLSDTWYKECKVSKLDTCINNDEDYKLIFTLYLDLLKQNHKKVIVLGMPVIQLENFPLEKELKRNEIIKRLCKKYKFKFVDVYEIQKKFASDYNLVSWNQKNFKILLDYFIMATKPKMKSKYSEERNLELTVDGVHYNEISARLIAKEVNDLLN